MSDRATWAEVLRPARTRGYPPGEFAEQESFVRASEVRALARQAAVGPGVSVLDLCCGIAGPGRLVAALGCRYHGVDADPEAVALARARLAGLDATVAVGALPPVPTGPHGPVDVVLLLETLLAFPADALPGLLRGVADALVPGGRFVCTVEEGRPLDDDERRAMPGSDTVHLVGRDDLLGLLAEAGLEVVVEEDHTALHREVVEGLVGAFEDDRATVEGRLGDGALDGLLASHRLWADWLAAGRVRKLALVARRGS